MDEKTQWVKAALYALLVGTELMPYDQHRRWSSIRAVIESCPLDAEEFREVEKEVSKYVDCMGQGYHENS